MGFIYEEMLRAQESLQSLNNAKGYETIWKIFREKSDPLFHPLYKASYYLNPQLCYGSNVKFPLESIDQRYAYLATMAMTYSDNSEVTAENQQQIEHQFANFSTLKGLFGSQTAIRARDAKDPAEWWDSYGNDCPELQRIAIRLLSLTCSSCGSGQIQNAYEQVCPKKSTDSYRRKLNDLFLVIQSFKKSSLDNELITQKKVGEASGAKKDILVHGDVSKGISPCLRSRMTIDSSLLSCLSFPINFSRNGVDPFSRNIQFQSAVSADYDGDLWHRDGEGGWASDSIFWPSLPMKKKKKKKKEKEKQLIIMMIFGTMAAKMAGIRILYGGRRTMVPAKMAGIRILYGGRRTMVPAKMAGIRILYGGRRTMVPAKMAGIRIIYGGCRTMVPAKMAGIRILYSGCSTMMPAKMAGIRILYGGGRTMVPAKMAGIRILYGGGRTMVPAKMAGLRILYCARFSIEKEKKEKKAVDG